MVAEVLGVGTELLLGDIANTNAQFLSKVLAGLGISVYGHTAVGDNAARLTAALEYAFGKADMVVACGGLGPTQDDITKEVSAAFFGKEMVLHQESWQAIQHRFGGRVLPENAVRNAMIPEGCIVFPNNHGSAPGVCIEEKGKILILLPGPPQRVGTDVHGICGSFFAQKNRNVICIPHIKNSWPWGKPGRNPAA